MTGSRNEVLLCADGPLVLRGPVTVEDEDGETHTSERSVVAVCRCGLSAERPWCDGTHKAARTGAPASASAPPKAARGG